MLLVHVDSYKQLEMRMIRRPDGHMKGINIMKYKVGDKVRVRSDLRLGATYSMEDSNNKDTVVTSMFDLRGQIVKIEKITDFEKYKINVDDWNWTDEMFEGLAEEIEFHVYDTVKHAQYGLGTAIEITDSFIAVDFDEKPFDIDFRESTTNVLCCDPKTLTLVQAYIGGEDD